MLTVSRSILLLILPLAGMLTAGEPARIVGSDLLRDPLQDALRAASGTGDAAWLVDFSGTLAARNALEAGAAEVAMIALPDGADPGAAWRRLPLCYQVVTLAVHPGNPTQSITFEQLRDIFSQAGRVDQWSHLLRDPAWASRKINLLTLRERHGVALEIFLAMVLQGRPIKGSLVFHADMPGLMRAVAEEPGSLAILPGSRTTSGVRLLPVAREAGAQAYSPTVENVMFGDYPLRLPFYIVWRAAAPPPQLGALLRYLYGNDSTARLIAAGLQPVSDSERQSYLLEYNDR
jgi:phosphate transport system substrate-binding protein